MAERRRPRIAGAGRARSLAGRARPRVAELVAEGGRFVMLVGLDERSVGGDGLAVEAVVARPGGGLARLRAGVAARRPSYPSITPLVPAAHWDEREANDLLGIVPVGHPDPRRLVLHERWPRGYHPLRKDVPADVRPPDAERHFVPFEVHGEGVYQLPVGPIHAGIIEPGHFRFSAIGERVLHLDARLFFVHRGLEKLVEGRSFAAAAADRRARLRRLHGHPRPGLRAGRRGADRHRGPAARALGAGPARRARAPLQPRRRPRQHLRRDRLPVRGLAARAGSRSACSGLNDALTGHRYLTGIVWPRAACVADLDPGGWPRLPGDARRDRRRARVGGPRDRPLGGRDGPVARHRRRVSAETAVALGALGVAARASGLPLDLRRDRPYAAYDELEVARRHRRRRRRRGALPRPGPGGPRVAPAAPRGRSVGCRPGPVGARSPRCPAPARRPWARPRGREARRGSGCGPAPTARSTGCACGRPRSPTGRSSPRRPRQPRPGLPADQQELRALLRLHGPLTMPFDVFDRLLRPLRRGPVTSRYPDAPPRPAAGGARPARARRGPVRRQRGVRRGLPDRRDHARRRRPGRSTPGRASSAAPAPGPVPRDAIRLGQPDRARRPRRAGWI